MFSCNSRIALEIKGILDTALIDSSIQVVVKTLVSRGVLSNTTQALVDKLLGLRDSPGSLDKDIEDVLSKLHEYTQVPQV